MTIDVRIDSRASGGLKVIKHIPGIRPCRLEGRNGIGKSVAIRLLSLAAGHQPYADDAGAWRSLKVLIGATTLQITGLIGAHQEAVLTFTPDSWPNEPVLEIGDWLGELVLDGTRAPLPELFQTLEVVHLSGTERLIDTLQRHEAQMRTALQTTQARLLAVEGQRARLGELAEQLAFLTEASERRDAHQLRDVTRRLVAATGQLADLRERLAELQRAATLNSMLASSSGNRQDALTEARQQDTQAQAALIAAQARLDTAIQALSRGTQRQKKRAAAEDKLRRLANELAAVRKHRSTTAASIDFTELAALDADELPSGLAQMLTEELAEATRLTEALRRRSYDAQLTEEQTEFRAELIVVLDGAIDRGNGAFVAARLGATDVTVSELREGVQETYTAYRNTDSSGALHASLERHQALLAIQRDIDQARSLTSRIAEAQKEIDELPAASASDDLTAEVAHARQVKDHAQAHAQYTASQVGQLSAGLLSGRTAEDAQTQVQQILRTHNVTLEQLPSAISDTLSAATGAEDEAANLERDSGRLRSADTQRTVRRREWRSRLSATSEFAWLVAGLTWRPDSDADVPWTLLADRVDEGRHVANNLVRDVEGLAAVTSDARPSEYADARRHALEREAIADFTDEHLAEALFDHGSVEALDLREQTITWHTAAGDRRTRPLTAFSSGEQALGFIRARLRQLTAEPSVNRLIFLDEFGAFVSADRRKPLAELLANDDLDSLSAQIIVVLPLQVDYASEVSQTRGDLQKRYATRVAEISQRGYFAETFDA